MMRASTLLYVALVWCPVLSGAQAGPPGIPFTSDFGRGAAPFVEVFRYYGEVELAPDAAMAPPTETVSLRLDFPVETRTMVGVSLCAEAGERLVVSFASAAAFERVEQVSAAVTCHAADGRRVAWIALTGGDIPTGRRFENWRSDALQLPDGTATIRVFLIFRGVRGSFWLGDVAVDRLAPISAALEARMAARGPVRWGVNDALAERYSRAPLVRDTCAKLMAAAGFAEARLFVWWGSRDQLARDIEPMGMAACDRKPDGTYDFTELDALVQELAYYGIAPGTVVVHGTPEWASGKTADDMPEERKGNWRAWRRPFFPPRDWGDYEAFVEQLVTHVGDKVRTWEVLNEPNTPDSGLHYGWQDAQRYIEHFTAAARRVDAGTQVIAGRVAPVWLDRMLAAGMAHVPDGVACHPYAKTPGSVMAAVRRLQLTMAGHGTMWPVYMTEIGLGEWQTVHDPPAYESRKAAFATEVFSELQRVSNSVCWWTSVRPGNQHGLLRNDGYCLRPMPAYWAAAAVIGRLSRASPPVRAEVELDASAGQVGTPVSVRLRARNTTEAPLAARFWPIGFRTALGVSFEEVRAADWAGVLAPGAVHARTLVLTPTEAAFGGRYPVGLAVLTEAGNSVELADLSIPSIASESSVLASAGADDPLSTSGLNDKICPERSWDRAVPRFVWPPSATVPMWVQYEFGRSRTVSSTAVMWLDVSRFQMPYALPVSWRVLYRDAAGQWRPVVSRAAYPIAADRLCRATFDAVDTDALRLEVTPRANASAGILEWSVRE